MTEEVTISAASPVVDTKKTATGATFSSDILENIPRPATRGRSST